jgi:hypothetical protein
MMSQISSGSVKPFDNEHFLAVDHLNGNVSHLKSITITAPNGSSITISATEDGGATISQGITSLTL